MVEDKQLDRLCVEHSKMSVRYWGIHGRCYNPNNQAYKNYGGRGIYMCDEWKNDIWEFVRWAEANGGLDESLSIDRIDNDGPYAPWNCRFVDRSTQMRNYRRNRIIEYNGESHCLFDWADITGIDPDAIRWRLDSGWSVHDALTKKSRKRPKRMFTLNGETKCLSEWCNIYGLRVDTVWLRLNRGWPIEKALTTPVNHTKGASHES